MFAKCQGLRTNQIPLRLCLHAAVGLAFGLVVSFSNQVRAEEVTPTNLTAIFSGEAPSSISDLRAMQARIQEVTKQVVPCTVAVRVGQAHGSGVIINRDGYVLTAAHVAGEPGLNAVLVMHDGRQLRGKTLGTYRTLDAGLIRIVRGPDDPRSWPYASMGTTADMSPGEWCLATGHPGGFERGRPPVLRVGRVLSVKENSAITTDCTLIGGDSGGPLFDTNGKVIGIHSRIGGALHVNLHVPVDTYRQKWDRLASGEAWGHPPGSQPFIGVRGTAESKVAEIVKVLPNTPAAKAGVQVGDVIVGFNEKVITDFDSLKACVEDQQPGTEVTIKVRRGDRQVKLALVIGNQRG